MATAINSMKMLGVGIAGTSPLIMHSPDGVNQTFPITKELSKINKLRTKTEEDKSKRNELSYLNALYHDDKEFFLMMIKNASFDEEGQMQWSTDPNIEKAFHLRVAQAKLEYPGHSSFPYIPAQNIEAMIRDGAKAVKQGKAVQVACNVIGQSIPLIYNGPKDIKSLMSTHTFRDVQNSRVPPGSKNSVLAVRPRFNRWFLFFKLIVNTAVIDMEIVKDSLILAGEQKCLGDQRPRYGRFEIFDMQEIPGNLKSGIFYEDDKTISQSMETNLLSFVETLKKETEFRDVTFPDFQ